tara:strand:- start:387 stop:818 length:432 start_codon:yes stop_codon:yes gene_type:complete
MAFLVKETHHGNSFSEKHIFIKLVRDEETAKKIKQDNLDKFEPESLWVLENYHRFLEERQKEKTQGTESNKHVFYEEICKFCDFDLLDEFITEILEKNMTNEQKYKESIITITTICFCVTEYENIPDWDPNKKIMLSRWIDSE